MIRVAVVARVSATRSIRVMGCGHARRAMSVFQPVVWVL